VSRKRAIDVSTWGSNTVAMLRLRSRALLLFLCIGIVMMRIGGAHLHYCFDGSEPPVSVHLDGHAGGHHEGATAVSSEHADMDVSIGVDILTKKVPSLLELLGLVAALTVLMHQLPRIRSVAPIFDFSFPPVAQRAYLRPPLRGPPL
jgi:hypothetical protein